MGTRFPFGIPQGWYAVATSDELSVGRIVTRRYFEREIVLFRTPGGVSIIDAHCPHMGAHLGRVGRIDGNVLRCGFHGFRFDGSGACVATATVAPPPEKARLTKLGSARARAASSSPGSIRWDDRRRGRC